MRSIVIENCIVMVLPVDVVGCVARIGSAGGVFVSILRAPRLRILLFQRVLAWDCVFLEGFLRIHGFLIVVVLDRLVIDRCVCEVMVAKSLQIRRFDLHNHVGGNGIVVNAHGRIR